MLKLEEIEYTLSFRAMNTDIGLIIYSEVDTEQAYQRLEQAGARVQRIFADVEECLSRFRDESELSRLNREGQIIGASSLLFQSVKAAVDMARLTNGIFDPTILDALEKAGYDRSFELIKAGTGLTGGSFFSFNIPGSYGDIRLDSTTRTISLPPGLRIDLGGIGKGFTVDRTSWYLKEQGYTNFMVNAGGDMYLSGCPPLAQEGWNVAVQNPVLLDNDITEINVQDKAVATSSVTKRRWQLGGQLRHHLIDPRTGQPAVNNLASVTVVAPTAQLADVLAKTALIMGYKAGKAFIERQAGCSALFITQDEEILA